MANRPIEEEAESNISLGALSDLAGYHVRRASLAFAASFARALAGTGVRQALFGIMSVVEANPGISQGAAGRVLGIQRANMVALMNEMIAAGWIERKVAIEDRRAFALSMTPLGSAVLADAIRRTRAHEEGMLSDLGSEERLNLVAALSKIEAKEA